MTFHNIIDNKLHQVDTESKVIPERVDISYDHKWNLSDIYKDDEEWERDFNWVAGKLTDYKKFEGKLAESAEKLLDCFKFDDEINIRLERLYLYSMLAKDSDLRVSKFNSMDDRVKSLYSKVGTANSFIRPELLKIPDEILLRMIESNKELKIYRHNIEDLLRSKAHTLSNPEEKILAMASELAQTPYNTFSIFTNADLKLPFIEDDSGNVTELSHGRF
jgi:oligoendopeptidase F